MFFSVSRGCLLTWLACLVVPSSPVGGQSAPSSEVQVLSLSAVRGLAAEANPELLAAVWRARAAQGDLRTARSLRFNPDVVFESRSSGDGFADRFEAEVGMEFELAGQRGLRRRVGEAFLAAARQRYSDEGRRILAEVSRAYHRLAAAEQRVVLVQRINRLNTQLHSAVQTQLSEGEVSVLEANLVAIEAARSQARTLEANNSRDIAALELGRMIGRRSSVQLRTQGPGEPSAERSLPSIEEYSQLARTIRPDLKAFEYEVEVARQEQRLTRRKSYPNMRVAGLAARENPLAAPRLGVSLGASLPLFNRNQGEADRRRAELAGAERLREAAELRVSTEVEAAWLAYSSATEELALLESAFLEPIRQNQSLLDTAYREGKIDLASLLLLRNQLLEAELSYWDAWERRERAFTGLESATGTILEDISFTDWSNE